MIDALTKSARRYLFRYRYGAIAISHMGSLNLYYVPTEPS
jgi:hypothetical protein